MGGRGRRGGRPGGTKRWVWGELEGSCETREGPWPSAEPQGECRLCTDLRPARLKPRRAVQELGASSEHKQASVYFGNRVGGRGAGKADACRGSLSPQHTPALRGQSQVPCPRSPGQSVPGSPRASLQRLLMIPLPEAGPSKGSHGVVRVDAVRAMGLHQTPAQMQTAGQPGPESGSSRKGAGGARARTEEGHPQLTQVDYSPRAGTRG